MNILFAYNLSEDDNQFVKIHIRILQELGYEVTASLEEFWQPTKSYDLVVINWPDSLYGWHIHISDEHVTRLNTALKRWKQLNIQIITFFHDEYSHFGRSANLNLLFQLCYGASDVLIHLGEYSRKKYTNLYPNAEHHLIYHPLYCDFQTDLDQHAARKQLGISAKDYFVFVPGGIRKTEEMDYCLDMYRKLEVKNKRLIFQKTGFLAKPQSFKNFTDVKVWVYYLFHTNKFKLLENISFLNGYMENSKLSAYFAAADLVIIPRTDILNSGNILLAAQFGKPAMGTGAGNMKEMLMLFGPQSVSPHFTANPVTSISEYNSAETKKAVWDYANHDVIKKQWQQILKS